LPTELQSQEELKSRHYQRDRQTDPPTETSTRDIPVASFVSWDNPEFANSGWQESVPTDSL